MKQYHNALFNQPMPQITCAGRYFQKKERKNICYGSDKTCYNRHSTYNDKKGFTRNTTDIKKYSTGVITNGTD